MYNFLLLIIFKLSLASTFNSALLDSLYSDQKWILDKNLEDGSEIYIKNIDNTSLQAIKISRNIEINPIKILNLIKDVQNYNLILTSSKCFDYTYYF